MLLALAGAGANPAGAESEAALPHVDRSMHAPAFWIARTPDPDRVRKTAAEIELLNRTIYRRGFRMRPTSEGAEVPGRRIRLYLDRHLKELYRWRKYDRENRRLRDPAFHDGMRARLALERIPALIRVRYGMTVDETSVRLMPTRMLVQRRPEEPDFDVLQNSVLGPGHPVAGYHRSRDGEWVYVQAEWCRGWVPRRAVAWARRKADIDRYLDRRPVLVVTGRAATVFADSRRRRARGVLPMGARLPLVGRAPEQGWTVLVPVRTMFGKLSFRDATVAADAEVNEGFLPLTPRQVAQQAFKWLGAPYGWGGTRRQLDCSRFVMNVLGVFGFDVPRTSHVQIRGFGAVDLPSETSARRRRLDRLPGLGALVEFPGHIGLYLGEVGGRHYLIHSFGSYYERVDGIEEERRVKRVVVSDMSLDKGAGKGTLLDQARRVGVFE